MPWLTHPEADTLTVLLESGRRLEELKGNIQELVTFFGGIMGDIKSSLDTDITQNLIDKISSGIQYRDDTQVVMKITLSQAARQVF